MTKNKSTKRALLMSALSMLLCVSMLIGSTFAWFTDSVTSGNNIIKSGNLDVELDYIKVVDGKPTDWATVKDKTDIFDPKALWEPGRVEIVYLRVSNLGSLELKYQLGVNVVKETLGKTETGADIKLSEHLVFKTIEIDEKDVGTYTREWVTSKYDDKDMGLTDYNGKTTALEVGGEDYMALIVYMPETVGNEANYRGKDIPTIELGINLYATQYTAENDSFGKDYDENVAIVATAAELNAAMESGKDVFLTKDLTLDGPVAIPEGAEIVIDGNGYEIASADGRQFFNGTLTNNLDGLGKNSKITVKNVHFVSNGGGYAAIVGPNDAGSMELTFDSCTFENMWCGVYCGNVESDASVKLTIKDCTYINTTFGYSVDPSYTGNYEVTFKNNTGYILADEFGKSDDVVVVYNADQLAEKVKNGATNIVLADGEYDVYGCGGKTLTLNGSKKAVLKLYDEGEDGCDYGFDDATVTFNGVTINTTANTGNYKGYARMNATFNNCDFFGAYTSHLKQTFNNCYFDFNNGYFWVWGAEEVNFNRCKFGGNSKAILAHGWASSKVNINDCDFAATEKGYTGAGDNTAAVEIDPAGTNTYTINFTGNNTITDSYAGWTRVKDGSTGHDITVDGDKVVSTTAELQAAINSGDTEIVLGAGEYVADLYVVSANRNLTITGQGAGTKLAFSKDQVRLALFDSLTISNCTIEHMATKKWGHLVFGSSEVAGGVYTISDCTFIGEGTQGIYINQTVAATFNIKDCTFNGDFGSEGAITIQDRDGVDVTVNVTDCEFNNIPATSHEICVFKGYSSLKVNADGIEIYVRDKQ